MTTGSALSVRSVLRTPAANVVIAGDAESRMRCSNASQSSLRRNGGLRKLERGANRVFFGRNQRAATERKAASAPRQRPAIPPTRIPLQLLLARHEKQKTRAAFSSASGRG